MKNDMKPQKKWYQNWWVWGIAFVLLGNTFLLVYTQKNNSLPNNTSLNAEQKRIQENQESLDTLLKNPDLLYVNELENQTSKWADLFSELHDVLQSKKSDPEEWEQSIYEVLFLMQVLIEESQTMAPTNNLLYIHEEYTTAIQHFEAMVTDLPTAIHRQDIPLIETCMDELQKGVSHLENTRNLISEYGNQNNEENEN
ncbi:MAG: hypothetical protein PHI40_04685 [Caldisericia bacterium]|nr:hypothetical protein [Caldisericia bacterium]MDD4614689.1 hypothetical protein [Caldisericia bacterium]